MSYTDIYFICPICGSKCFYDNILVEKEISIDPLQNCIIYSCYEENHIKNNLLYRIKYNDEILQEVIYLYIDNAEYAVGRTCVDNLNLINYFIIYNNNDLKDFDVKLIGNLNLDFNIFKNISVKKFKDKLKNILLIS